MGAIRVLVVDDSYFMRQAISKIISVDGIEVIGEARNGKEAIEKVKELDPDLVTLDIEMPVMNGLQALEIIMKEHPVAVLMVSTLTSEGAEATIDAISLGAIDFITKRAAFKEMDSIRDELISKVKEVGGSQSLKRQMIRKRLLGKSISKDKQKQPASRPKVSATASAKATNVSGRRRPSPSDIHIVAIGTSTGGPPALQNVLCQLPADFPVPIVVVQHMPPFFTKTLSIRLDKICKLTVKEAETQDELLPGKVFIAPGGKQMLINKLKKIIISDNPKNELYKPSVNVLFDSVFEIYNSKALGVIMTGMGHDGTEGLNKLFNAGAYVLAQSVDTCVVGGMPKTAIAAGVVDEIYPLGELAGQIALCLGKKIH